MSPRDRDDDLETEDIDPPDPAGLTDADPYYGDDTPQDTED